MRLSTSCGLHRDTEQLMCSMRLGCTSEDECKWFTAIWFILLKQSKTTGKTFDYSDTECCYYLHTKWRLFTMITYSVHDGSSLSRRTLLPYSWLLRGGVVPSPAAELLLILLPAWRTGPSPIPPTLPGWPHFPQGPGTFPHFHRTQLILCKIW
jgi:hypothetical protein